MSHRLSHSLDVYSDEVALHTLDGGVYLYSDLKSRAHEFQELLMDLGVTRGHSIAISHEKNFDHISLVLACLQLGVVYIPLDVNVPEKRFHQILIDSKPQLVFCKGKGPLAVGYQRRVSPDLECEIFYLPENPKLFAPAVQCVLYTSGSTGVPKGVVISHENILSFVSWAIPTVGLNKLDVVASLAPMYFDLSTFDVFASLMTGASIVLFDHKAVRNPRLLTQKFKEYAVSRIYTTPTVLRLLVGFGKWESHCYDELKTIIFAGEVMPPELLFRLRNAWPEVDMFNWYGPTETNVVTSYKVRKEKIRDVEVPIGRSCDFAECLVEVHGELKEFGIGELHVGGPSVAMGYVSQPQDSSFYELNGKHYYATGDIVKIDTDGVIYYIGREDRMIKRYGNRVELGDIEAASMGIRGVSDAAALFKTARNEQLYLFVRPSDGEIIDVEWYRMELAQKLPTYMLPDHIFVMEEWPLNPNHKTDYSYLENLIDDRFNN